MNFLLILSFLLIDLACLAQLPVRVSDPRLEIKGNIIHISYDILNSQPGDQYNIEIEIRDEDGQLIKASAFDGDIGEAIQGGSNKHITWNLESDNVFIDASVFITIVAEMVRPSEAVIAQTGKEDRREPSPEKEVIRTYSRTVVILQSLAFPGWGLSRITGNPHWIRGVVGYGCIAGSVIFNRQAIATYEDYRYTAPGTDKEAYFTRSTSQDNISEVLAYTAIGIWVMDFIWTVAGSSDLRKQPLYSDAGGFSVSTGVDSQSRVPLIGIRYRF